tara:strand:- start:1387 stop:1941 length:555 start_codon:yes stop_codon:yes gene_type:complete
MEIDNTGIPEDHVHSFDENDSEGNFHSIPEEPNYELRLTVKEVLFIDDSLSLLVSSVDQSRTVALRTTMPSSTIGSPIDFIQKIGLAILEITAKDFPKRGLVSVHVSDMELLLLREIAKSHILLGDDAVGLSLKTKVYEALYGDDYKAEKALNFLHADLIKTNPELVQYLDGMEEPKVEKPKGE